MESFTFSSTGCQAVFLEQGWRAACYYTYFCPGFLYYTWTAAIPDTVGLSIHIYTDQTCEGTVFALEVNGLFEYNVVLHIKFYSR